MNEIIINIDNERDAYAVSDPNHLIYLKEYERIKELLRESIKSARKYANRKDSCGNGPLLMRKHDTIMLAGGRGSGKTTFMLSILEFIKKQKIGIGFDDKKNSECEIESLHILDPTLIENKTHIFINIISMIKDKVDEKAKIANCFNKEESELSRKYMIWEKSFKELAEGLPSIDGVGSNGFTKDSWLDAEFVMDNGVRMAHAANSLEHAFHNFVRQSLDFLGKEAFILCFDDIDTNFAKGWPVLEVLHKYLTTPQMITILSGDPGLYSILIRQQQWGNFSNRLLKIEAEESPEFRQKYKEIVAHLEEQYFLKLLKPERRLFLNSLYRKSQQESEQIIVRRGMREDRNLRECYKGILKTIGIHSGGQQELFYRFLSSAPLRTQKQLLCALDDFNSDYGKELSSHVIDIFWSDLTEKKIDVSNLRNAPHYAVPQIINYLIGNNVIIEGYTLTPIFSDHFINGSQFALGTIITDRIKRDPTQIFEFWLRVCLTRELGSIMEGHVAEKNQGPSIEDYVAYCAINKLRTSRYVSRFSTAYIRAYLGYQGGRKSSNIKLSYAKNPWHGTLPLLGLKTKAKRNFPDRIDYVLERSDYFTKVFGYLPLSGSTNHRGESLPVYSIYNLLGVLGEILLVARSSEGDLAVEEVSRAIIKNSQYREYPLPAWHSELPVSDYDVDENIDDEEEGLTIPDEINKLSEFSIQIVKWATCIKNPGLVISPSVLGKIFTRFFYAMNNMDKALAKENSLGCWMHRIVVAFLHSIVLVESMEKLDLTKIQLNLKNPIEKDTVFIENIAKLNKYKSSGMLEFSRWMLSCPIWKVYMKNKFDCSGGMKGETEFNAFTRGNYNNDFNNNINNGELHNFILNNKLSEVSINIDKTYQQKQVPINQKYKLPNFSVAKKECMNDFIITCGSEGLDKSRIELMDEKEIISFLKEKLSKKYNENYFTNRTATSIKKRIVNGDWKL